MAASAEFVSSTVKRIALEAGFDLAGIAPAVDSPELERFPTWITAGHAGEMEYMKARNERGELKRASLARIAPWAQSVVVCAVNYNTTHPYSTEVKKSGHGWISRYAWGHEDYHEAVLRRLKQVETALHQQFTQMQPDLITRSYVDTGPVVERVFAKYAGLGWFGKNTCIINQGKGSWLFLGVILTSMELKADLPAPDRCGSCTRCIEACPTDAFVGPYQLDSTRCISYLTIEKRGAIPEDLRAGMGQQVFGCDICQDVCPWNRKAPHSSEPGFLPRSGLLNPALQWLAEMSEDEFRDTFTGSPVRRAKRSGLRRNSVIAMGNSRMREFLPILERLISDSDEVIADSAAWAVRRLQSTTEPSDEKDSIAK